MDLVQQASSLETLKRFLADRRDSDFTKVVEEFLDCSDEERLRAFLFSITSAKLFANIIVDRGELTPSTALLIQSLEVQMIKLAKQLEERQSQDRD